MTTPPELPVLPDLPVLPELPVLLDIKQQVREFYDRIGWQEVSIDADGGSRYQNARYEDLRPVAREYIHRCHMRVARHLKPSGKFFLDAGSGPIQYREYLEYSRGYQARVCADISIVALQEARRRIGDRQDGGHGLFVVADVARLPFKADVFEGLVSLHTIHHLPDTENEQAYRELYRVLIPRSTGVVVNGWGSSRLMAPFSRPVRWVKRLSKKIRRMKGVQSGLNTTTAEQEVETRQHFRCAPSGANKREKSLISTYVSKNTSTRLKQEVGKVIPLEILVWRSVTVGFLRTFIHPFLGGRWFLRLLFWLEERYPHFFGENGQYPLIVIHKA